jgi:hypothetical protein
MSLYSTAGNGAIILTIPNPPLNLANNAQLTSGKIIALQWNTPSADGGTPVIDYRVSYDYGLGTESYFVLASSITQTAYSATGLVSGVTYKFKV